VGTPHHNHPPGGPMTGCDCGATPEEQTEGRHYEDCTSREGQPDDPYDHYGI